MAAKELCAESKMQLFPEGEDYTVRAGDDVMGGPWVVMSCNNIIDTHLALFSKECMLSDPVFIKSTQSSSTPFAIL